MIDLVVSSLFLTKTVPEQLRIKIQRKNPLACSKGSLSRHVPASISSLHDLLCISPFAHLFIYSDFVKSFTFVRLFVHLFYCDSFFVQVMKNNQMVYITPDGTVAQMSR